MTSIAASLELPARVIPPASMAIVLGELLLAAALVDGAQSVKLSQMSP